MDLEQQLATILPSERILTRLIERVTYAADAGFYHLLPRAIVRPVNEEEVQALFALSRTLEVPLVFRTGGTSLSGQSITDGILVDLSRHWNKVSVLDGGRQVRVQPGITGAMVNAHLTKHHVKIGPDPSSISAAMMGGILSNNASGMCCGVTMNSYHTTKYIRFILPDGACFSTEVAADYDRFLVHAGGLAAELVSIREEIGLNSSLRDRIRYKYTMKNTVGYSLNAFIDHVHPLDIFAHLLIGGEGTLAFIAEAVLDTVPDEPYKATALLYFTDIYGACQAIQPLIDGGAVMVELMDRASLRSVEALPGVDPVVATLPEPTAALLVEFQERSVGALTARVDGFLAAASSLPLIGLPAFHTDAKQRDFLWKLRKGMFPAVGAVRARGTTVILEDVTFPLVALGDAVLDLQAMFLRYGYDNAIIFGHAKDGNLHFVVTQAFDTASEIERYDRFLRDVVELVVTKYDGSLKAEHGTGRNMAPFVETEWGGDAYRLMERIKAAADPRDLLNPGVIINKDKEVHIKNLKAMPAVEEEVDKCIECGYCEPVCPSRELTMTPRRRIVARRVLKKMEAAGDVAGHTELLKEYQYDGMDTCAVDGLCAGACPVYINTGDLVKRLRRENHSASANKIALVVAKNFGAVESMVRFALKAGSLVNKVAGRKAMFRMTALMKKVIPGMPLWSEQLGAPPSVKGLPKKIERVDIVYFPSCIARVLGGGTMDAFLSVCAKVGVGVKVAADVHGSCCGQIFGSKGFGDAYRHTAHKIVESLWVASEEGRLPVVIDTTSCAYTFYHLDSVLTGDALRKYGAIKLVDSVDFLHDQVLPRAAAVSKKSKIVLHPVCSLQKTGTTHKFRAVAQHFATEVVWPLHAGCCGMAGDRGFLFPELTAAATRAEAADVVAAGPVDGYYSSTRTCEIAMSEAVKENYSSILSLADECLAAR